MIRNEDQKDDEVIHHETQEPSDHPEDTSLPRKKQPNEEPQQSETNDTMVTIPEISLQDDEFDIELQNKEDTTIPNIIQAQTETYGTDGDEDTPEPTRQSASSFSNASQIRRAQSLRVPDKEQSFMDRVSTIVQAVFLYSKKNFNEYIVGITGCLSLSMLVLAALGFMIFCMFGLIPHLSVKYGYTACECFLKNVTVQHSFGSYRPTWVLNVTRGCQTSDTAIEGFRFPYLQDWEYQTFIQAQADILQYHQNLTTPCLVKFDPSQNDYSTALVGYDLSFSTGQWFVLICSCCLTLLAILLFLILWIRAIVLDVLRHLEALHKKELVAWDYQQTLHVTEVLRSKHLQKLQNGYEAGDQPTLEDPQDASN